MTIVLVQSQGRTTEDAVESITLNGPYETGSCGMTKMKGQEPIHWKLFEVKPPERAVTEMQLADAVVRFAWTYDELPGGGRRMIQQISLEGPGAAAYVPLMGQHFAPNVPTGMERLVREIEKAAAEQPASPAHQ